MKKAYCPELDRIVTIYEARKAFLNQSIHDEYHFFCPDPNCVQPGNKGRTQFSGHSYKLPYGEIPGQKAHFQLFPGQSHSPNCLCVKEMIKQEKTKQVFTTQVKGTVNTDNTKTRYTNKPIKDNYFSEFELSDDADYPVRQNTTSSVVKQGREVFIQDNAARKNSSSSGYKEIRKKSKQFAKLIKEFLDIQKKIASGIISETDLKNITLTVNGQESCVFDFFRNCQNIYHEPFNGCCIGGVRYIDTQTEDAVIFRLYRSKKEYRKNNKDDERPIFVYLPKSLIKEIDRHRIYSDIDTFIHGKSKFSQKIYFMSFSVKQEKDKIIFFINNSSHLYIKNYIRKNN